MLRRLKTSLLCATTLAGLLAAGAPSARAANTAAVAGNVAGWVASANKVGVASPERTIDIVVHMQLRNPDQLKQLADAVSKPGNAQYGHYLGTAAFRAQFSPAAEDVTAVQAMLTQAGMTNLVVGPAGAYVSARATVAQIASTFQVSQDLYSYAGRTLRANREAPMVPAALVGKIISIEGLDDTTFLKHPNHRSVIEGARLAPATRTEATPAITPPPVSANLPSPYCDTYFGDLKATLSTKPGPYARTMPWLGCGYSPKQIQAAYGFDRVKLDGTGVRVAIVDAYASPTLMADGNKYAANHALPALTDANFTQIIPQGIYNVSPDESCGPYGWWGEESLDLAAVHGSAPGAHIVYVGARDCGSSLSVALLNTIYNQQADIITNSYGYNGEADSASDIAMQDQAFMAAAAQGITVLFSSGDDGDLSQVNGVATGSFSADSPYVTGVGGTTLALYNAHGGKSEWGWGTYRDYLTGTMVNSGTSITTAGLATTSAFGETFYNFAFYSGAGGGISLVEPQPAYQANVVPAALATTLNEGNGEGVTLTPRRVSPDISMLADPYTGYLIGESYTIAGNPVSDAGCTPTGATTEYCEIPYGGTSLASPLMAGVMAVMNQARMMAGKPLVGFANPLLYGQKLGSTLQAAAINDIVPPVFPIAVLRGYATDPTRVRVVTVNSVPALIDTAPFPLTVCSLKVCEGLDDVFNVTATGYDDVTGLGVPYVPNMITQ